MPNVLQSQPTIPGGRAMALRTHLYITDLPKTQKAISTQSITTGALDWSIKQVS